MPYIDPDPAPESALSRALARFAARKEGAERPQGTRDTAGRWYPSPMEAQPCCGHIREPSRAWPWSLFVHCMTAEHVAALEGVPRLAIRSALAKDAARKRPARTAPTDLCLDCGASLEWGCDHNPLSPTNGLIAIPDHRADMRRHLATVPR